VYKLSSDLALVFTLDFFPPIVDDPYDFGAIAAANSLSDIYAMGAKPICALNIIGFPEMENKTEIIGEILRGGAEKSKEAGVAIIGGHTIKNKEPIYGLAVVGKVHPHKVITNSLAKDGDSLILTKPLGIGIITTALKQGRGDEKISKQVVKVMSSLNKIASEVMVDIGVNACTDITGFGLLGHLFEMTRASKVGAEIYFEDIPFLPSALNFAKEGLIPGGTIANFKFVKEKTRWDKKLSYEEKIILSDAQTSGGLLMAVDRNKEKKLLESLRTKGVVGAKKIGQIIKDKECQIKVKKR
jgi:selenide,water dikinase